MGPLGCSARDRVGVLMSEQSIADIVAKRIALALAVTCVLAALALSALFVSYPVEAAGYDTFEPAFDCVRRAGE